MENTTQYNTLDMRSDPLRPNRGNDPRRKKLNRMVNIYIIVGFAILIIANLIIASPILLPIAYRLYPSAHDNEVKNLTENLVTDRMTFGQILKEREDEKEPEKIVEVIPDNPAPVDPVKVLPPIEETLPATNNLIITKIGVNAPIIETADVEAGLQQGAWIVNDFGTPVDPFAPIIIASHRWGGVGWSDEQRASSSFYRLPETIVGDQIEIVWGQRKYIYEIYKTEENTQITDYEADLILYTCKVLWDSPDRIFRYAKRIN